MSLSPTKHPMMHSDAQYLFLTRLLKLPVILRNTLGDTPFVILRNAFGDAPLHFAESHQLCRGRIPATIWRQPQFLPNLFHICSPTTPFWILCNGDKVSIFFFFYPRTIFREEICFSVASICLHK